MQMSDVGLLLFFFCLVGFGLFCFVFDTGAWYRPWLEPPRATATTTTATTIATTTATTTATTVYPASLQLCESRLD